MAPKKKGNKKGNDDWEAELGETIDPIAQAIEQAKADEATKDAADDDQAGGGGLLAALKKNKGKRKNKGKQVEDWVEGEDPPQADGVDGDAAPQEVDLAAKAPQEATMDDEDTFEQPAKKGKGGKGGKQAKVEKVEEQEPEEDDDGEEDAGGRVKTKKEKEKEKKEREKQRKREQVCSACRQHSIYACIC